MGWQKILLNPKTAGAVKKFFSKGKVSDTITNLTGKYNIGAAKKIKNKASQAKLNQTIFNFQEQNRKFKGKK